MQIIYLSIILIFIIMFSTYLLLKINTDIRKKAYKEFLRVERLYVKGHGKEKMQEVTMCIKEYISTFPFPLSTILNIFISEKFLTNILEKFFTEVKDFLNDGKRNGK